MDEPTLKQLLENPKGLCNSRAIKNRYHEFYIYVINNCEGDKFSEKLYNYFYPNRHKCPICGKNTSYLDFIRGYREFCSRKCQGESENIKEKIRYINIKKYGGQGFASNKLKNKFLNTIKIKYNSIEEFNKIRTDKSKQTCLNKYGHTIPTKNPMVAKKISDKLKQNTKDKYKNLVEYTKDGNWICKCPHPDECKLKNECTGFYETKSHTEYDRIKWNCERCTILFPINSVYPGISNSSQNYFKQLDKYFKKYTTFYASKNKEYKIGRYNLDFYIEELKIDIEYNGCYIHMNPLMYNATDIMSFKGQYRSAQEIWEHDEERKKYIESHGIKVITIWDNNLINPKELYKQLTDN